MRSREIQRAWDRRSAVTLAVVCLLIGALVVPAGADRGARKLDRQVGVFESVVDEMLVDSPNWLVRGRENARAVYVDGYGVVLTFEASLVDRDYRFGGKWWKGLNFLKHKGDRIIVRIDDDDEVIEIEGLDDEDLKDVQEMKEKLSQKAATRQEKRYQRGKTEIIDVILDHGDFLTNLKSEDWLEVVAVLHDAEYFEDNDLHRLSMRVKMKDLREYADDKLSEENVIKKIEVREN